MNAFADCGHTIYLITKLSGLSLMKNDNIDINIHVHCNNMIWNEF